LDAYREFHRYYITGILVSQQTLVMCKQIVTL